MHPYLLPIERPAETSQRATKTSVDPRTSHSVGLIARQANKSAMRVDRQTIARWVRHQRDPRDQQRQHFLGHLNLALIRRCPDQGADALATGPGRYAGDDGIEGSDVANQSREKRAGFRNPAATRSFLLSHLIRVYRHVHLTPDCSSARSSHSGAALAYINVAVDTGRPRLPACPWYRSHSCDHR